MSRLPGGQPGHCDSCGQPASEEQEDGEAIGPGPWAWLDMSSQQEGGGGAGQTQPPEDREGAAGLSKGTDILGGDLPRQGRKSGRSHWLRYSKKNSGFQNLQ